MATTEQTDLAQYLGRVMPVSFEPWLLVLSYLVSLVGAASTLELIHRRTSRRGYYNNLLLFGASITMGGVAIWSMHYIGNRATTLLNGEPEVQIAYSVGVTVASFFVPIVVLIAAFFVVTGTSSTNTQVSWWRVGASGVLSGGAICGMHYLGNASISNYQCIYLPAFVVGSATIAAAASTVALALFFVFRSSWTNSWWKRLGCSVVLAGAVSGMHWCAVMGTRYRLLHINSDVGAAARNTTVIVTACLSFAACVIIAGLAMYSAKVRKGYSRRAQRITLAAAVFDENGRILVTPDGFLPSEVVTSTFLQKTHNETFSTAHPLFHWIFQASRSWTSITTLLDKMNRHLATLPHTDRNVRTGIELVDKEGHVVDNYETIFCELFCVAAAALASQMNEDLVEAGVLWDDILATGGTQGAGSIREGSESAGSHGSILRKRHALDDLAEKGTVPNRQNSHGHLMFLVRKVDSAHVDHLAAAGYCFAEPRQVSNIIRSKMQIRTNDLDEKLKGMEFYSRGAMMEPGVHVGIFAVRTQVHQTNFEILVKKRARNLLPTAELPMDRLENGHFEFLRRLEGMTLGALHRQLGHAGDLPPRDAHFAALLLDGIRSLRASVQDPVFDNARLVSKVTQVPCKSLNHDARPTMCTLIAFTLMVPVHIRVDAPAYEFIPLEFFKTQQLVYKNSPHNAAFGRAVHRTIAPVLDAACYDAAATPPPARYRDYVGRFLFPWWKSSARASHAHYLGNQSSTTGLRPTHSSHQDAVKLVSPSRENITDAACNESVASLPLYSSCGGSRNGAHGGHGGVGDSELASTSTSPVKSPGEVVTTDIVKPAGQLESPQPSLLPTPLSPPPTTTGAKSFGGIMISQEVTVDVEETEDIAPAEPDVPSAAHYHSREPSDGAAQVLARQKSLRPPRGMPSGACPAVPAYDQAIELKEVSNVLGMGASRVEVKKERDDAVTTFVDDLFSTCIDTPKRV
ncbi:hypothetical protein VTJ49DRAFT_2177 [Mycothermus thermophilus]|uniref:MHYT domain-containing protein n=1 Tax=Humicola insolens TaxID=85995 RepID=A0ABR3VAK5_HUMIN